MDRLKSFSFVRAAIATLPILCLPLLVLTTRLVVAAAGISRDDLMITLYETPGENISFGQGLAQRAHTWAPKSAHAENSPL